jgi:hypothetical protein
VTLYCENLRCQHERAILAHQVRRLAVLNVVLLAVLCWGLGLWGLLS